QMTNLPLLCDGCLTREQRDRFKLLAAYPRDDLHDVSRVLPSTIGSRLVQRAFASAHLSDYQLAGERLSETLNNASRNERTFARSGARCLHRTQWALSSQYVTELGQRITMATSTSCRTTQGTAP